MSEIVSLNKQGTGTEQGIRLDNAVIARTMGIGSNWTDICIGVQWSFTSPANTTSLRFMYPGLMLGVSANKSRLSAPGLVGDSAYGMRLPPASYGYQYYYAKTTGSYDYWKAPISNYYIHAISRIGTAGYGYASTNAVSSEALLAHHDSLAAGGPSWLFLNLEKSGTNIYTRPIVQTGFQGSTFGLQADSDFLAVMESGSISGLTSQLTTFGITYGYSFWSWTTLDEATNGGLDSIVMEHFSSVGELCYIHKIAITKWA